MSNKNLPKFPCPASGYSQLSALSVCDNWVQWPDTAVHAPSHKIPHFYLTTSSFLCTLIHTPFTSSIGSEWRYFWSYVLSLANWRCGVIVIISLRAIISHTLASPRQSLDSSHHLDISCRCDILSRQSRRLLRFVFYLVFSHIFTHFYVIFYLKNRDFHLISGFLDFYPSFLARACSTRTTSLTLHFNYSLTHHSRQARGA